MPAAYSKLIFSSFLLAHHQGSGTDHPTVDSPCSCHYEGTLIDGTKFDSSYDRGSPTTFAPNQVIKGWTEAMQLMVEGALFMLPIVNNFVLVFMCSLYFLFSLT